MKTLIVIPARKGSSYHRKNLQPLNGIPLVRHTLFASLVPQPHDTIVTTDDAYVIEEVWGFTGGVSKILIDERPTNLCDDQSTLDEVMYYMAVTYPDYSTYVCLPPTAPLRKMEHVSAAIDRFHENGKADSLVAVTGELKTVWANNEDGFLRPIVERTRNRQECEPVFISNGAIFISRREAILKFKKKAAGMTIPHLMEPESSVDIHSAEDLHLAEYYLKGA